MAYRIQNRRDTAARWAEINPILLDGEIGIVSDDPNLYKMGDGVHTWNELPLRGYNGNIAQSLGDSPNAVVSQKVLTEKLTEQDEKLSDIASEVEKDLFETQGFYNSTNVFPLILNGAFYFMEVTINGKKIYKGEYSDDPDEMYKSVLVDVKSLSSFTIENATPTTSCYYSGIPSKETFLGSFNPKVGTNEIPEGAKYVGINFLTGGNQNIFSALKITTSKSLMERFEVVSSGVSIVTYGSEKPTFTLDFENQKLIAENVRVLISDSEKMLFDATYVGAYETAFVGNLALKGNLAFIVFNITDKKFYLSDFQSASLSQFPEYDEKGNLKNIKVGSIINQYGNHWCFGFNFSHIKIDGVDFYGSLSSEFFGLNEGDVKELLQKDSFELQGFYNSTNGYPNVLDGAFYFIEVTINGKKIYKGEYRDDPDEMYKSVLVDVKSLSSFTIENATPTTSCYYSGIPSKDTLINTFSPIRGVNEIPEGVKYVGINFLTSKNPNLISDLRILTSKTFKSESEGSVLAGKRVAIFGDSISTFSGYIPQGNAAFYPRSGYDVTDVEQTWWKIMLNKTQMQLTVNQSWSGSRISNGRGEVSFFCNQSRYGSLGNPDIIILFGGTNDFAQGEPMGKLGEFVLEDKPTLDLQYFKQAYQFLILKLQELYPQASIYVCTPIPMSYGSFGKNSEGWSLQDCQDTIRDIAKMYGVRLVDLNKCGINPRNYTNYLVDVFHPNVNGMKLLAEYIQSTIEKDFVR